MGEQIVVSEAALDSLNKTRPWVKFFAILGFVLAGLVIFGGLMFGLIFAAIPTQENIPGFLGPVIGLVYIAMGVFFYIIPCLYLLRYANAIESITSQGQAAFENALRQQKSFWKYMAIFVIVVFALYILLIVVFVSIGITAAIAHH